MSFVTKRKVKLFKLYAGESEMMKKLPFSQGFITAYIGGMFASEITVMFPISIVWIVISFYMTQRMSQKYQNWHEKRFLFFPKKQVDHVIVSELLYYSTSSRL